jgi:hypothetical protein
VPALQPIFDIVGITSRIKSAWYFAFAHGDRHLDRLACEAELDCAAPSATGELGGG